MSRLQFFKEVQQGNEIGDALYHIAHEWIAAFHKGDEPAMNRLENDYSIYA